MFGKGKAFCNTGICLGHVKLANSSFSAFLPTAQGQFVALKYFTRVRNFWLRHLEPMQWTIRIDFITGDTGRCARNDGLIGVIVRYIRCYSYKETRIEGSDKFERNHETRYEWKKCASTRDQWYNRSVFLCIRWRPKRKPESFSGKYVTKKKTISRLHGWVWITQSIKPRRFDVSSLAFQLYF